MQQATLSIEIRNFGEKGEEYRAYLSLPAKQYEIRDAMQRARILNEQAGNIELTIDECPNMPEAENVRLDAPKIDELNFFAKRLLELTEEEEIVLRAVAPKYFRQFEEDELVSIKDLINLTYGLDELTVLPNVEGDGMLGQFVIENDLHEDVKAVPFDSRYLLDEKKIGRFQRENNEGVYIGNAYVEIKDYVMPEDYDGETMLTEEQEEKYVFRLKIAKPQGTDPSATTKGLWLKLPIWKGVANEMAKQLGVKRVEDCVCLDFETVIPQIKPECFSDMKKYDDLNRLAEAVKRFNDYEEAKFKAILEAGNLKSLEEITEAAQGMRLYDFAPQIQDESEYFKEYLRSKINDSVVSEWLDNLTAFREGAELMLRLGTRSTDYGYISAKNHMLFEYITRKDQNIPLNKKFDLITICEKPALFTNERINNTQIPDGLNKYEIREDDEWLFATLERTVTVNYSGTVLAKEPIDLGEDGVLKFDNDSSPNFLGEEVTLEEYLQNKYDQTEGEKNQSIGVIKQ